MSPDFDRRIMISAPEKPPADAAINMAGPDLTPLLTPKRSLSKKSRGELLPSAKFIPLTIAALLAVATALECHSLSGAPASFVSWILSLAYGCLLWVWWAAVVEALWRTGNRRASVLSVSLKSVGVQILVALGVVSLHLGLLQISTRSMARVGPTIAREGYGQIDFFCLPRLGLELLIYGLVWFACAALHTQLAARRDAIRSLELEKQLSSAHLRALQMQLEPHFLFNTLNAVTTLMELNRREEALETLGHLNIILKTVLKRNSPSKIPLVQELEIVESYLAIERVRFADRLRVDLDLDPGVLDGLVPCFLLQPIVENAIRHGIAHCEREGCIETSAKLVGTRMQLQVRDNGPGLDGGTHSGFGVGLLNTRERLNHFYQDDYELRTSQPESGGFEVSITIPFERTAP
jgi:signal transduction histidine kinase